MEEERTIPNPETEMRDNKIKSILDTIVTNFKQTVETSEGVWFNQSALVMLINAFQLSKFRETCSPKIRFFNAINQALVTSNRKSKISAHEISLSIDDRAYNFLLNAARAEYIDDYDEDGFLAELTESQNTYGTAVTKVIHRNGNRNIIKVVPFSNIIWDQNDAENHPMGEVFSTSLEDLQDKGMYSSDVLNDLESRIRHDMGQSFDARRAKVKLYEIHGKLPIKIFGDSDEVGVTQGMFIVAETNGGYQKVVYVGREEKHPYHIYRRKVVDNRSMGLGVGEELLDSQITTNEIGNLILEQLRATSKVVYQSSDTELDGQDLQEIDNLTLISHEEGAPITQVSTQPTSYSALQSFMNATIEMGRAQSSIQDFSLGAGPKSNTSFAAIQAAAKEADGQYTYFKEQMFRFIKKLYKAEGGIIDIIVDYMESGKDIESLLSPYQLRSFKSFIAEKKAEAINMLQAANGALYIDDIDLVKDFVLKNMSDKKTFIELDTPVDRKYIRDKSRLSLGSERDIIATKILEREAQLRVVSQNPQAFPSFSPEKIFREILELQDIGLVYGIEPRVSQSGQIGITPTGPTVAAEAGLVNSL